MWLGNGTWGRWILDVNILIYLYNDMFIKNEKWYFCLCFYVEKKPKEMRVGNFCQLIK